MLNYGNIIFKEKSSKDKLLKEYEEMENRNTDFLIDDIKFSFSEYQQ